MSWAGAQRIANGSKRRWDSGDSTTTTSPSIRTPIRKPLWKSAAGEADSITGFPGDRPLKIMPGLGGDCLRADLRPIPFIKRSIPTAGSAPSIFKIIWEGCPPPIVESRPSCHMSWALNTPTITCFSTSMPSYPATV